MKKIKITALCLLAVICVSACGATCERCGASGQMYKFTTGWSAGDNTEKTESILCEKCLKETTDSWDSIGAAMGIKWPYSVEKL